MYIKHACGFPFAVFKTVHKECQVLHKFAFVENELGRTFQGFLTFTGGNYCIALKESLRDIWEVMPV